MTHGSSKCSNAHCCLCRDRPTGSLKKPETSSASALGKRPIAPKANLDSTQKKPRHATIVHNTVATVMDSWYRQENEILCESLEEQEEGYCRIINNLNAKMTSAEEIIRVRETQLMQYRRFCLMVMQWCPQAQEMFPGDFEQMTAIHQHQNTELADFIRIQEEETDTEE